MVLVRKFALLCTIFLSASFATPAKASTLLYAANVEATFTNIHAFNLGCAVTGGQDCTLDPTPNEFFGVFDLGRTYLGRVEVADNGGPDPRQLTVDFTIAGRTWFGGNYVNYNFDPVLGHTDLSDLGFNFAGGGGGQLLSIFDNGGFFTYADDGLPTAWDASMSFKVVPVVPLPQSALFLLGGLAVLLRRTRDLDRPRRR